MLKRVEVIADFPLSIVDMYVDMPYAQSRHCK